MKKIAKQRRRWRGEHKKKKTQKEVEGGDGAAQKSVKSKQPATRTDGSIIK